MRSLAVLFLGLTLCFSGAGFAQDFGKDKTEIMEIPTDLPVPPKAAEKEAPLHPFFSESATNDVMEQVEELKGQVKQLEARVKKLEEASSK